MIRKLLTIRMKNHKTKNNSNGRITLFTKLFNEGPILVFLICNRCIYHKTVNRFEQGKYSVDIEALVTPFSNYFTCFTCNRNIQWQKTPAHQVYISKINRKYMQYSYLLGWYRKNILPRDTDSSYLLIVRFKPKLSDCGHAYFEVVRPNTL